MTKDEEIERLWWALAGKNLALGETVSRLEALLCRGDFASGQDIQITKEWLARVRHAKSLAAPVKTKPEGKEGKL